MDNFTSTERSTIKRLPKRGVYDRASVYGILDEGFVCHVGFIADGKPFVIPTGYARVGEQLYLHGSRASRMLKTLQEGVEVCVTVTLIDGLVLARSAFHHSMNYRSVIVFGQARAVEDDDEKMKALLAFSEHVIPNRWAEVRPPTQNELNATLVLSLPLKEASAKVRSGPPLDDDEDYDLPIWAGVLPLALDAGEAIRDPRLADEIQPPAYLENFNVAQRRLRS